MAKTATEPKIIEDAEEARQADYNARLLNRLLMLAVPYYLLISVFMVWIHVPVPVAVLIAAAAIGGNVWLRRYFKRRSKLVLRNFLDPITGELSVPGGAKPVRWIDVLRAATGTRARQRRGSPT